LGKRTEDAAAFANIYRYTILFNIPSPMINSNLLKTTDYQALAEFRYQIRRFLRFSEDAARQAGLEPQHHQLMLAVKGAGGNSGPRIAYLAERLQLQHHSVVELVDRLAQRGLIQKTRGADDQREVHVKLTPQGDRILKHLTLHHREELRTTAPALVSTLKKVTSATRGSRKVHGARPAISAVSKRSDPR
jgi:DNA-binding MarR family transcriptional regulator